MKIEKTETGTILFKAKDHTEHLRVKDLIKALQQMDPEMIIKVRDQYNDYSQPIRLCNLNARGFVCLID